VRLLQVRTFAARPITTSPGLVSYQSAETVTLSILTGMTGHRAGHLSPHVLNKMTGSVAGRHGVRQCFAYWYHRRKRTVTRTVTSTSARNFPGYEAASYARTSMPGMKQRR
jgi:hypothetical protein